MNERAFDAVASEPRRQLLLSLLRSSPRTPPYGRDRGTPDEESGRREAIAMHHVHLPKLDEYGYVTWMRDLDVVVKGPKFDEIGPLLELIDDYDEEPIDCLDDEEPIDRLE